MKKAALNANYTALKSMVDAAQAKLTALETSLTEVSTSYGMLAENPLYGTTLGTVELADSTYGKALTKLSKNIANASKELDKANGALNSAQTTLTGGQIAAGTFAIVLGAVMMGVSIWQLTRLYSKYEINYTDIPDNMVHVVNYKNYGDRFINYKNVPAYYYDGNGALQQRENDLNAYNGREWVSLYYTKNYEAGYCLTATPDLIATESPRSGYSGIRLFGYTSNYNLNSHCNRENAQELYLAFKYSTNKKSAETDVPDVVGTIVSYGAYAFAGLGGMALGMGLMTLVSKKKKKKDVVTADGAAE
jgi:hypothetical protein